MQKKLPNFFIVGAPKAGTTSLYYYLDKHPEVFMSPIKEPNYFSYNETVAQDLYHKEKGVGTLKEYLELFKNVKNEKIIGEASVSYLYYPSVPQKIYDFNADSKIVIVLRNPVDRAFSHYFMEHKLGYVHAPLEKILLNNLKHKHAHLYYQQYVKLGIYTPQVKRYLDIFGKDRVKIFIYEDLDLSKEKMIRELFDFLSIDKSILPDLNQKHNSYSTPRNEVIRFLYAQKTLRSMARKILPAGKVDKVKSFFLSSSKKKEKHEEAVAVMKNIFRPDIIELEKLLNKNLSSWYEQ
ncbi:MAG: sulfotransferase [Chitinophagales bacterium]|nr:sulfotransferase [Chitinophagales bacterium]